MSPAKKKRTTQGIDLEALIKLCKRHGVLDLEVGNVKISLSEPKREIYAISQNIQEDQEYHSDDE